MLWEVTGLERSGACPHLHLGWMQIMMEWAEIASPRALLRPRAMVIGSWLLSAKRTAVVGRTCMSVMSSTSWIEEDATG